MAHTRDRVDRYWAYAAPIAVIVGTFTCPGNLQAWTCATGTGVADVCLEKTIIEPGGSVVVDVKLFDSYWCEAFMELTCIGALPEATLNEQPVTAYQVNNETVSCWDGSSSHSWPVLRVTIPPYSQRQLSRVVFKLHPCFRATENKDKPEAYGGGVSIHGPGWSEAVRIEVPSPPYVLWTEVKDYWGCIQDPNGYNVWTYVFHGNVGCQGWTSWGSSSTGQEVVRQGCASFPAGTVVNLLATPDPCYCLISWQGTGNDDSNALTNTVTMDAHKNVTVAFSEYPCVQIDNDPNKQDPNAPGVLPSNTGCGTAPALLGLLTLLALIRGRRR
ncbi:MAG: hypothetical protein JXQ73_16390 [Phycisphaerae bacterium]|nr:hypothetical protein [Phycisphaerae bacterium]